MHANETRTTALMQNRQRQMTEQSRVTMIDMLGTLMNNTVKRSG